MSDIIAELQWRGLVQQQTDEKIAAWLNEKPRTLYIGFDPTADSLHVGSLLQLMTLRRFQKAGHRPIALVGGATGMIGDPSGKSAERNLLSPEILDANVAGMAAQMRDFLNFEGDNAAVLVNNYDWMSEFTFLSFLRDIGKHSPVNVMLSRDSVKSRIGRDDGGISYTEFSYMLLQAYDFVHLNRNYGCELQVGGSDQWGNITAGIDLARRMHSAQLYGVTSPLLLTSEGKKMGKTEKGAVWLSADKTSEFDFYQYWIRVKNSDVIGCLKFLTELPQEEIAVFENQLQENPDAKIDAQQTLAEEITRMVHGEEGLQTAKKATDFFYGGSDAEMTDKLILQIYADAPGAVLPRTQLEAGLPVADALPASGLVKSKGEGRRAIKQGGVYVNNQRVADEQAVLKPNDLASESFLVLRRGKRNYALLRFVEEGEATKS